MRQLLMTALMIIVVVGLYTSIVGGKGGTKERVTSSGERMADRIARMNP